MFCNLSTTARISKRVDGGVAGRRVTVAAKLLQRQHSDKHNNNNKTNATPMQTFLDTSLNSFACARNAKHKRVTETEREGEQESGGNGGSGEVPSVGDCRHTVTLECQNVPARH